MNIGDRYAPTHWPSLVMLAIVAIVIGSCAGGHGQRCTTRSRADNSGPPANLHERDTISTCRAQVYRAVPFANGRARPDQLSRIAYPEGYAYLRSGSPAAAWNTMNVCATRDGVPLYPQVSIYSPAATAYRSYGVQVILRAQLGTNAAVPGTSNHGWGQAVDLRSWAMRNWTDAHGGAFGFQKRTSDAPWEWWHVAAALIGLTWSSPDPGSDPHYPNLQFGSRGLCLSSFVKRVQRAVGVPTTGRIGGKTSAAIKRFKSAHGLKADDRVTHKVWAYVP